MANKKARKRARRSAARQQPGMTRIAGRAARTTIRRWRFKGRG